jgi:hypothetical protein
MGDMTSTHLADELIAKLKNIAQHSLATVELNGGYGYSA